MTAGRDHVDDAESDGYQDDAYAFFVACFHLKDWLTNDPASRAAASGIEALVSASHSLSLCADIANGSKHLRLTRRPRVDASARIGRRRYELHISSETTTRAVRYEIHAAGKTYDAFELAQQCTEDREGYLAAIGLLARAQNAATGSSDTTSPDTLGIA